MHPLRPGQDAWSPTSDAGQIKSPVFEQPAGPAFNANHEQHVRCVPQGTGRRQALHGRVTHAPNWRVGAFLRYHSFPRPYRLHDN